MWNDIYASDYGWTGKLRMVQDGAAVDISSYTTRQFIFRSPSGTLKTKTAAFDTDGTDGVLKYVVESGVIDASGRWIVQVRISKTNVELTSQELPFFVYSRIG
jgi:hypothetical protein